MISSIPLLCFFPRDKTQKAEEAVSPQVRSNEKSFLKGFSPKRRCLLKKWVIFQAVGLFLIHCSSSSALDPFVETHSEIFIRFKRVNVFIIREGDIGAKTRKEDITRYFSLSGDKHVNALVRDLGIQFPSLSGIHIYYVSPSELERVMAARTGTRISQQVDEMGNPIGTIPRDNDSPKLTIWIRSDLDSAGFATLGIREPSSFMVYVRDDVILPNNPQKLDFANVLLAHELGHNLSLVHTSKGCQTDRDSGRIMNASIITSTRDGFFADCEIQTATTYIREHLLPRIEVKAPAISLRGHSSSGRQEVPHGIPCFSNGCRLIPHLDKIQLFP